MQYVSLLYLLAFLPLVLLAYGLSPQRHRWKLLLAASYIFYGLLSKTLIIYLLFSTISIHEHVSKDLSTPLKSAKKEAFPFWKSFKKGRIEDEKDHYFIELIRR